MRNSTQKEQLTIKRIFFKKKKEKRKPEKYKIKKPLVFYLRSAVTAISLYGCSPNKTIIHCRLHPGCYHLGSYYNRPKGGFRN